MDDKIDKAINSKRTAIGVIELIRKMVLMVLLAGLVVARLAYGQFSVGDEYLSVNYDEKAVANPVARLQAELNTGTTRLEYADNGRGYLDSLLAALDIDPASQMLVFSPTSLQHKLISPETPRALFFNDITYIGFVQNSHIVEVTTIDSEKGIVFYTFDNTPTKSKGFERSNQTCLVCHDTQGTMGGGVPMLMTLSTVYSERNVPIKNFSGIGNVVDQTPIAERWGGWYVTGSHGLQPHLGNMMLKEVDHLDKLDDYRIWNLKTLSGSSYLDPSPYPSDTSDIVALMILEHQVTVQNQITYTRFKAPAVMKRRAIAGVEPGKTWAEIPVAAQTALTSMLDKLVNTLVFMDAAEFSSPISGSAQYTTQFMARGLADTQGRTLRDLDLGERLFRYPLSYLVYTDDFLELPVYARDYVYNKLARYLSGAIELPGNSQFSLADRRAALDILVQTHPEFRSYQPVVTETAGPDKPAGWKP